MLFPFETLVKIYSCTKLLSWYSSIAISTNFSLYFFAISVSIIFPFSFFNKIFKAKCSISLKSTIFFSFFLSANFFENSIIKFSIAFRIPYILYIFSFASAESYNNIFETSLL